MAKLSTGQIDELGENKEEINRPAGYSNYEVDDSVDDDNINNGIQSQIVTYALELLSIQNPYEMNPV